ncbi:hypothetical protein BSL78_25610 [Apostichopus japonicus]|uniref:Uncharacterized protein n=1 Tax=Stichopus japonicus TaxID=307972 RepID=A0A2G8JP84_STIJA|nr:hypothetical protein BSL78_25610 [Apostichopus japonicus]
MTVFPVTRAFLIAVVLLCVACKKQNENDTKVYLDDVKNQSRQIQGLYEQANDMQLGLAHILRFKNLDYKDDETMRTQHEQILIPALKKLNNKKKQYLKKKRGQKRCIVSYSLGSIALATRYLELFGELSSRINNVNVSEVYDELREFNRTFFRKDEEEGYQLASCAGPVEDEATYRIKCRGSQKKKCTDEIIFWFGLYQWLDYLKSLYREIEELPIKHLVKVCMMSKRGKNPCEEPESTTVISRATAEVQEC